MRVFLSHSSKDKPAVEAFATALRERGIDAWLDKWEIGPGDDIVASINQGLDQADAGIIAFSKHSRESRWVEAEVSYLTYSRIKETKKLIPVTVGEGAWIPPLLRPLARRGIEEIDAIADALLNRRPGPPALGKPAQGRTET
ncbi:MAG: toll/interleukin-1 receptor domain-containing protein, partial [Acetobacteraceae bacterium]|nr:toll/interleukin-1 receptor domain-containing protein [Acetobacteraceae bacterium]